jgi:hypothetical protein
MCRSPSLPCFHILRFAETSNCPSGIPCSFAYPQILYTNKRMKSLDESCYGYRRSRAVLAPGFSSKVKGQMEAKTDDDRRRRRISASHWVSPQLPRERRLSGSQKLIAKLGREETDLNR